MKVEFKNFADRLAILVITFTCGYLITEFSPNFPRSKYLESESYLSQNGSPSDSEAKTIHRDPAAIKRTYDFSNLEGSALDFATKQRLLEGVKLINDKKDIGVELGHFVIRGSGDEKLFACERYSKVILTFEGDGVAVGGELPKMEVEGACEISADINSISPVWIPVSQFLKETPADGEYDFKQGHVSRVRFYNISDSWPKVWVLRAVHLRDDAGTKGEVSIFTRELNDILKKPLILKF